MWKASWCMAALEANDNRLRAIHEVHKRTTRKIQSTPLFCFTPHNRLANVPTCVSFARIAWMQRKIYLCAFLFALSLKCIPKVPKTADGKAGNLGKTSELISRSHWKNSPHVWLLFLKFNAAFNLTSTIRVYSHVLQTTENKYAVRIIASA